MEESRFSFDEILERMRLTSDDAHYGPAPKTGDVAAQRLTLARDGRVWLSQYVYGAVYSKPVLAERHRFHIAPEAACDLLNAVSAAFRGGYEEEMVTDAGAWDLTLTDAQGRQFKASGPLLESPRSAVAGLSDRIRTTLNRNDLLLFDGNVESW